MSHRDFVSETPIISHALSSIKLNGVPREKGKKIFVCAAAAARKI